MEKRIEELLESKLEPYVRRFREGTEDEHDVLPTLFAALLDKQRSLETAATDQQRVLLAGIEQSDDLTESRLLELRHVLEISGAGQKEAYEEVKHSNESVVAKVSQLAGTVRLLLVVSSLSLLSALSLLVLHFVK